MRLAGRSRAPSPRSASPTGSWAGRWCSRQCGCAVLGALGLLAGASVGSWLLGQCWTLQCLGRVGAQAVRDAGRRSGREQGRRQVYEQAAFLSALGAQGGTGNCSRRLYIPVRQGEVQGTGVSDPGRPRSNIRTRQQALHLSSAPLLSVLGGGPASGRGPMRRPQAAAFASLCHKCLVMPLGLFVGISSFPSPSL